MGGVGEQCLRFLCWRKVVVCRDVCWCWLMLKKGWGWMGACWGMAARSKSMVIGWAVHGRLCLAVWQYVVISCIDREDCEFECSCALGEKDVQKTFNVYNLFHSKRTVFNVLKWDLPKIYCTWIGFHFPRLDGVFSPQEGCAPAEAQDGWAGRCLGVAQEGGKVRGAQRSWTSQFSMVHKMGNDFTKRKDIRIYIDYYSFWPDVIEAYPGVQDYWVVSMECVAVKIRNKNGLSALKLKWPL